MKIVIDIPEEEYNKGQLLHYFGCYSKKLDSVIYNGVPLPKGYGRLIDADALLEKYGIDLSAVAPTIIEADKEE